MNMIIKVALTAVTPYYGGVGYTLPLFMLLVLLIPWRIFAITSVNLHLKVQL